MCSVIKIVIIEDETLIRRGLILTIPWEKYGCIVVGEARNGIQGKKIIEKLKPDIVITDVRMPEMDGITMIRELLQNSKVECEYIIISGYNEFEYAQQAVRLGVKDYLLKPVGDEEFAKTLTSVVSHVKNRKKDKKMKKCVTKMTDKVIFFEEHFMDNTSDSKQQYVLEAIDYIKSEYQQDITIRDVAGNLAISESYLSRLFRKETGYTFVEYLTNYRIKEAIELLKNHKVKIYEVSQLVGFNDPRYFSTIFKKYVGISPTDFKDSLI